VVVEVKEEEGMVKMGLDRAETGVDKAGMQGGGSEYPNM